MKKCKLLLLSLLLVSCQGNSNWHSLEYGELCIFEDSYRYYTGKDVYYKILSEDDITVKYKNEYVRTYYNVSWSIVEWNQEVYK